MENKLKAYLTLKKYTVRQAAVEIGISRQRLHIALRGEPVGKSAALKIERWCRGFVSAAELMQI